MNVSETFLSIQGEGPMQGRPAFFIRLAGCNLNCAFCDTPYAKTRAGSTELVAIRDKMLELVQSHGRDLMFVFTGGEPLLQEDEIVKLLGSFFARSAKRANAWFETNGTVIPTKELVKRYEAKFVVSPKMGHIDRTALKALSDLGAHIKLVVDPLGEESFTFNRALTIATKEFNFPKERVWMQPMGNTLKALTLKISLKLWELCAEHGVNYSPRTHVLLFGNKRGV